MSADRVKNVDLKDNIQQNQEAEERSASKCLFPFHTIVLIFVFIAMVGGWSFIAHGQASGKFYDFKISAMLSRPARTQNKQDWRWCL